MTAVLKFDLQKGTHLHFSEENYLNYTKTIKFFTWQLHFLQNKGEARTGSGTICDTLNLPYLIIIKTKQAGFLNIEQDNVLLKNECGADHPWLHAAEDCVQNQDVISTESNLNLNCVTWKMNVFMPYNE